MVTGITPREFIDRIQRNRDYHGQIVHVRHIAARRARYADPRMPLPQQIQDALVRSGVEALYEHQAQALDAIRTGQHVIVATPTASGKTLIYNLAVAEAILTEPKARALYLFPTKALAQDQLRALQQLGQAGLPGLQYGLYDGDTPQGNRRRLRQSGSVILTNPDMLHLGILPNHTLWSHFLSHLRYVVLDEAHVYRGVFGSQVACVIRRLLRLCRAYGATPQFIFCSGTIGNPAEHASRLCGMPVHLIDKDGSPQGSREFVLWNPPLVDEALGTRRSASAEAAALLVQFALNGLRSITFARARKAAELLLMYARATLEREAPQLAPLLRTYRAGYRPELRREIEAALFSGELLGVTATNALELGVDIGHLDATVLVGYPGSVTSTWQQVGRAGRGIREALSILIAQDNPLDQYFMRNPEALFGQNPEQALISPDNAYLLQQHLPCAAYERPLSAGDESIFGPGYVQAMIDLERQGTLEYRNERWYYRGRGYPAEQTNLRSASGKRLVLLDESQDYAVMEELDQATAPYRVHPGAVYLHQGETFLIRHLDLAMGIAYASPTEVDYYTQPREINEVRIERTLRSTPMSASQVHFGVLDVTQQVIGYRCVQQFSDTVLATHSLDLPAQAFSTTGLWFEIPADMLRDIEEEGLDVAGGLHALEHAAIAMLPLFAMCDRMDIGGLSTLCHPDTNSATVFIYDAFPGGMGLAEQGFNRMRQLWQTTLKSIRECPCQDGCPGCIQSPKCGNNNEPLDKRAAVELLQALLGEHARH